MKTPNSTGITVHKALVTRVQRIASSEDTAGEAISGSASAAPSGNVLISLAVQPGDAEQIVFTAEFGRIWLARESASAVEQDPVLVITRANIYR